MICLLIQNELGQLVLWAGLGAMFVIFLITVTMYVPGRKKKK